MVSRPEAGARLRRLLAIVPWVLEHPGSRLDDIAARFSIPERELERDLELVWMCGLPPYSPDRMIDVDITDGRVWIRFAEYFARPLRLTADEGATLLAAGRALLAVPGSEDDGALARALAKLERALGMVGGMAVEVGDPEHLGVLRRAAEADERVEIDYYSYGRDAMTTRRIDPYSVFHAFGHWYVDARCHLVDDDRLFRADRVHAVRETGETFARPADRTQAVREAVYHPRPGDPQVTVDLPPDAGWVVESYPCEAVEERPDGSRRIVLRVSERAWLERLLLRLGPGARVVEPPELRAVGSTAAARLLRRYRGS